MPKQNFTLNGESADVDCDDDVRLLWVLRDMLGVTGPKYGCGINVCKACTSHINGKAFNPCSVRVGDIQDSDEITTIEGLADTWDADDLHPMQEAWIDNDVAQCGYCQPGQIMAAVAKVRQCRAEGRAVDDDAIDELRNICRCGTYNRIREAIKDGARCDGAMPPSASERTRSMRARRILGLGSAAAAILLLVVVGVAHADDDDTDGYPSTQSPSQGADAVGATLDNGRDGFTDASRGDDRPSGADGTESRFGGPDERFLEGPLGGLVKNGPLG